jgi:hypothetical protein
MPSHNSKQYPENRSDGNGHEQGLNVNGRDIGPSIGALKKQGRKPQLAVQPPINDRRRRAADERLVKSMGLFLADHREPLERRSKSKLVSQLRFRKLVEERDV